MTPKYTVQQIEPTARLDFYESLRGSGKPCWFIRQGQQGPVLSDICASPQAAWRNALSHATIAYLRSKVGLKGRAA